MKPWDYLTEAGKCRRLRPLATAALARYPIVPTRLRLIGGFTNAVFRVDTAMGPYAMRVELMQDHTEENVAVELAWLEELRGTEIDAVRIVPAADGELSVHAGAPGVPDERRCVLFEWVPGKTLHEDLTAARYHQLGRLSGSLHTHGAGFTPPFPPLAWDRIFYWPEDIDPVVYHLAEHAHHFTASRRRILERAIAAVTPAFDRLSPGDAQVVHGDLHPWNVHVHRSRLIALDFEDVSWAHPVQDVAITLFYERDHPEYTDLRAAFEDGYRSVATWPAVYEGELEHFMAARTIMFINFVLNIGNDPTEFYARAFSRLEAFLANWG